MEGPGSCPAVPGRHIDCAGGRAYVRELGEGGTPLVLLHGVLSDGLMWAGVMSDLARDRRVLAPDLPLHGETVTPETFRPHTEGMVRWLDALLDALGAGRVDLCGLSMGGAVASHFARLRPGRVRRLVLVDAANIVPLDSTLRDFLDEVRGMIENTLGVEVGSTTARWTEELGLEGEMTAAVDLGTDPIIGSVMEYLEARGIPLAQALAGLELLEPLGEEGLGAIEAPTLAIWGADDPYFDAATAEERLERGLAQCRVVVLEGTGHNPAHEAPGRLVELVTGFLA